MIEREPPTWARRYVGRRFGEGGNGPDRFDCYGLFRTVAAEQFGVMLPMRLVLARDDIAVAIASDLDGGDWRTVEPDELQVGDAAVFRIGPDLGHVGMVVARGKMLHITEGIDAAIENLDSPVWAKRLVGFYRYEGRAILTANTTAVGGGVAHTVVEAGETIQAILAGLGAGSGAGLVVYVGGHEIRPEWWSRVRPKPGRVVSVGVRVAGSEQGKTPARIALTIGVISAAALVPALLGPGGAFLTGLKAGSFALAAAKAAVGAGIAIGGTLLTNVLAPLSTPKFGDLGGNTSGLSPAITGTRNELRQYSPIPRVLGRFKFAPPYGAKPFTEQLGDDEFLRALFLPGYGPVEISDIRIGETPIEDLEDVEVELRYGSGGEDPPSIIPGIVEQEDVSVELIQAEGFTTRTTEPDVDEISLDFLAPAGLAEIARDGSKSTVSVALTVEYRPTGSGTWLSPAGATVAPRSRRGMDLVFREPEAVRIGEQVAVAPTDLDHPLQWSGNAVFDGSKPAFLPTESFGVRMSGILYGRPAGNTSQVFPGGRPVEFVVAASDAADVVVNGKLVASNYDTGTVTANPDGTPVFPSPSGVSIHLNPGANLIEVRLYATGGNPGDVAVGWRTLNSGSFSTIPSAQLGVNVYNPASFGSTTFTPNRLRYEYFDGSGYTSNLELTDNRTEPVRKTFTFGVERGQYDVRVRRDTPDDDSAEVVDSVFWRTFRTITNEDPVSVDRVAKIAVRIRSSNQLSGTLDTLNCVVASVVPNYHPDEVDPATGSLGRWVDEPTSNPASLYRAVLQAAGTPINDGQGAADDEIDLQRLEEWWEYCDENGFTFNAVYDFATTVGEVLQDIASAGRASPAIDSNNRFSVVIDRERTTPLQHFTPRNSRNLRGSASFSARPHGLKMRFIDESTGYQQAERIVLDDAFAYDYGDGAGPVDAFGEAAPELPLATRFDVVELFGTTNADLAWKIGRYQIAVARLRPEIVTFETDLEHLAIARGDPFYLTTDVLLVGLGAGRIARIDLNNADEIVAVALDEAVRMAEGNDYAIRVRSTDDGSITLYAVVTEEGETNTLTLANPIPTDGSVQIPMVDDLVAFGEAGTESLDMVVAAIGMGPDLTAQITAVANAPAVHLADQGEIPDWNPNITDPPDIDLNPDAPTIVAVRSDDYVMVRGADGSLQPRIVITLGKPLRNRPKPDFAEIQIRAKPTGLDPTGPFREVGPLSIENQQVSIDGVDEGVTYQIRIRVVTNSGRASDYVEFDHLVIGKTLPPPDVESFNVLRLADGTRRYIWDLGLIPKDIAGVRIRYGTGGLGLLWDALTPLNSEVWQGSPTELNFPAAGTWTFGIKMVDTSGNESQAALLIDRTLGPPREEDVALSEEAFSLGWPGTKTDCSVDSLGILVVDDESTWDTSPSTWDAFTLWTGNPVASMVYTHTEIDIGFALDFIPAAEATGAGAFTIEYRYKVNSGDAYSAWAEVDPTNEVTVYGRFVQYRITVDAEVADQYLFLSRFVMQVRAPTRELDLQDIDTSTLPTRTGPGDVRLPIGDTQFRLVRTISVSFNGMGAGFSWEVVDKNPELGPRIRIFDADDLPSDAIIDATIRGL